MTSVSQFLPADFFQKLQDQSTAQAVALLRGIIDAALPRLTPYLPLALGILFVLLIIASVKALFGRTGTLGSLLYHIFYFGILVTTVWIRGLEVLFSAYFDAVCAVLYPFCYWLTGQVIRKFKSGY